LEKKKKKKKILGRLWKNHREKILNTEGIGRAAPEETQYDVKKVTQ